ncbi:MAG: hypothetical protein QUU85_13575, partial [Candidatus Eisenbacteria bacterium]|nr:hypothetical protein [Candidatus Eisenbacteria bacterium]
MTRSSRDEDRSKDHRDENPARLIQEMLRDLAALSHAQARLSYRLLRLAERLQDSTIQPGSRVVAETGAAGPTMAAAGSGRDAEAQPGIADRETREALQETTSGAEEQAPASAVEANEPAMPQPAAQPVPGSESETKTKTEPDTEPATQQEPDTQQRPQPEPQPEPEPAAESTAPRNGGRPEVKAASPEPVILEIEAGAETEIEAGLETGIATAAPASVSETPAAEAVRSDAV